MKYLFFYPEKCTGCKQCSLACSLKKFGECNPKKSAISVVRDEFERFEYAIFCLQCDDPICLEVCHQNSYFKEDGIIKKDEERCIGCRLCSVFCPYSAITVIDDEVIKCDFCGGDPLCVKYCSTQALVYIEETKELAKRRKDMVEKLTLSAKQR